MNFAAPGSNAAAGWVTRVVTIDASYNGVWDLPVIGMVSAPTAVLIRPDGYVTWVGQNANEGLVEALTNCFGTDADVRDLG